MANEGNHDICDVERSPTADKVFPDIKSGKSWQERPKCGLQTERSDGYNPMT